MERIKEGRNMNKFTPKEIEVIKHLPLEVKDIAGRLGNTPATIRTHICRIMQKTGAETKAGCLIELIKAGIVNINDVITG
jgi:DNA-binding NarL/FixJ family response regulator